MSRTLSFQAGDKGGEVEAILNRPRGAAWLLVLAHGAGAGMRHPFMETISDRLATHGVATFRYQFPYMQKGNKRPDRPAVLTDTVRAAVATASRAAKGLPLLAGGKSMGGRMASTAASEESLPHVKGLVFLGFPLHATGRPSADRGAHLAGAKLPMLFLQGSRDKLAELALLRPLCRKIRGARVEVFDQADHSFRVPKRTGLTHEEVIEQLAGAIAGWAGSLT